MYKLLRPVYAIFSPNSIQRIVYSPVLYRLCIYNILAVIVFSCNLRVLDQFSQSMREMRGKKHRTNKKKRTKKDGHLLFYCLRATVNLQKLCKIYFRWHLRMSSSVIRGTAFTSSINITNYVSQFWWELRSLESERRNEFLAKGSKANVESRVDAKLCYSSKRCSHSHHLSQM